MHILKVGCSIRPFLENKFISFLKKKSPTKYHPSKGVVMFNHIYKFQIHIQLNLWDVKLAKNKEKEKTVSLLHLIFLLSLLCVFCVFSILCIVDKVKFCHGILPWSFIYTPQHPLNIWEVQVFFKTYYKHVFWWGCFAIPPNGQFSQKMHTLIPDMMVFVALYAK